MNFFEDFIVGSRYELGRYHFTADDIKRFARTFDPQPFHLDEEAASRSHFGALVASGWHTAAAGIRLFHEARQRIIAETLTRGEPVAKIGPWPGIRNLKWPRPVFAGDTIRYVSKMMDKRPLSSRPGWGVLIMQNTGFNQNNVLAFEFEGSLFVERRNV